MLSFDSIAVSNSPVVDDDDLVFAYQIGAGVDYAISNRLSLDLGYRFFGTGKPKMKDVDGVSVESECHSSGIQLGLRYMF